MPRPRDPELGTVIRGGSVCLGGRARLIGHDGRELITADLENGIIVFKHEASLESQRDHYTPDLR
jgi:hypothetical protein